MARTGEQVTALRRFEPGPVGAGSRDASFGPGPLTDSGSPVVLANRFPALPSTLTAALGATLSAGDLVRRANGLHRAHWCSQISASGPGQRGTLTS